MKTFKTWLTGIVAAMTLVAFAGPATALDDDGHQSIFQTFSGIVTQGIGIPGLIPDKETPTINYRERPPLVLPPTKSLRAPLPPVRARNAAWPKDYDRERVRRSARPSGAVLRDDAGNEILSPQYLRNTGRLRRSRARNVEEEACNTGDPLAQPCNVGKMWSVLKNNKSADTTRDLVPGQEPERTALTDPPPGLRVPSRRVKATFEPVQDTPVVPDPRQAIRDEAARDREYR